MNWTTFWVYIAMYVYGFSLMIWAVFFDKRPSKLSRKASIFGLVALCFTLIYFGYVLLTYGITDQAQ